MQNFIDINFQSEKIKTSYSVAGEETNPVLLFVHGNSSKKETFNQQIEDFKNSYRIYAMDLPGHGETEKFSSNKYSIRNLSDFIKAFVEELQLKVSVLVGHSLGGHLCLQIVNHLSPGHLILSGTPPMSNPPRLEEMFLPNPASGFLFKNNVSDLEMEELYKNCFKNLSKNGSVEFAEIFRKTDPRFREELISELSSLDFKDELRELEAFNGKVLFVQGQDEKIISSEYLMMNCGDHQIEMIGDSSHYAHIENPNKFNNKISLFLKSNNN